MLDKTKLTANIDFNDNVRLNNIINSEDKNYKFRQGRIDFTLELTPINGDDKTPVDISDDVQKVYIYNSPDGVVVDEPTFTFNDKKTMIIEGQESITDRAGLNYLIVETSMGTSWNMEYMVSPTPGYKHSTIHPSNLSNYYTATQINQMLGKKANKADVDALKRSSVDKTAFATQLKGALDKKLDLDLGNVDTQGFNEKLKDSKVAFTKDLRVPYKKDYIEVQENTPVTIPQDVTSMTIALQSTQDAQPFTFTLPNMKTLPNLEKLHIRLIESQSNGGERGQFVIKATRGQKVLGNPRAIFNNVLLQDIMLEPNLKDLNWDDFYGAEEKEEVDTSITISDEYGESETTNHIQLDRGLKINKGSHNVLYDDPQEDEFTATSQTEEPLQMATKIGLEPNMLKELAGNDGFYASLQNPTELTQAKSKSKPTISRVFIDDVIIDTLGGVQINRDNKTYGIQEIDGLDPNISGGEAYMVAVKLSLKGNATEDFTFTAQLNDSKTNLPITDSNGSVYEVSKSYKAGDVLGNLVIYGVDIAKGVEPMYIQTTHDNTSDGIVLNDKEYGNTSIAIQELTKSNRTGKYINQFMMENEIKFNWNHQYVGDGMFSLKYLMPEDYAPISINVGNVSNDGVTVFTSGMVSHSVKNKMLTIKDTGSIVSFGIGKVFDSETSKELGNSDLTVKATLADPTNAVRMSLMGYSGSSLMKDNQIITGYNNGTPVMDNGWSIISSTQINENPENTVNAYSHVFNVPMSKYNNIAVFVHTADAQSPNSITIQDLEISSDLNKSVWTVTAPDTIAQMKYRYSDDKLVLDEICPTRFASLRYTINSKPTVMPVGVIKSGNAMLKPVKIWSDSGYEGEGGLEALTDMNLTIDYQTFINTLLIGEKAKGNQTIRFYVAKNQVDWKNPIVGQPDMTNVLNFDPTKKDVDLNFSATISLKKGDQIAFYMSANVDDGAYLQATTGKRLYETVLTAEEVVKK